MRKQLCDALLLRALNPNTVCLTGDLGFMALEPLQNAMGPRFINAGLAEQNMVSVAAGLARQQFEVWLYSIAPFCYARPFEQIRNDVAFHHLPVKFIGNGGGYAYGVMGPTHHAIEDYGVLLCLPNMRVFVPAFDEDVGESIARAATLEAPSYTRLGRGEPPSGYAVPRYAPWRQLAHGSGGVLIVVGPLVGSYLAAILQLADQQRPNLWVISELPLSANPVPPALITQIVEANRIYVAEEHVAQGGFASALLLYLAQHGIRVPEFHHLHARAHHFERYGSQRFLREQSMLDAPALLALLQKK
jgi:transketolase